MENWLFKKKNVFFGVSDQNLGPRKFLFCLGKRLKTAKRLRFGEKFFLETVAWYVANKCYANGFFKVKLNKSKQSKNRKKKMHILKKEGALPADHVYWATFNKILENENGPPWQMIRIEHFQKNVTFQKSPLFGPKNPLFRSFKRPKTTIKSEVKSNLKKKNLPFGMFATNHV